MKALLLTLFFLWNCAMVMTAQQYQFKKYKVEDGLVSNETFDIIQDSKNRIWITTTGGISCFNGKTFKNYTTENGLASNSSFSIFEDSQQRIWVGTLNKGVSIIENGRISNSTEIDYASLGSANSFLEAEDGTIYIIFLNGIVTYKSGKWKRLDLGVEEGQTLSLQRSAWYDSNTIYITSLTKSVFKLSLNPLKFQNIYKEIDGINNICYSILIDDNKIIWVGAYGGLYKIFNNNIKYYEFNPNEFDKNRVYDIVEENESELVLSFEGNGFGIFDKRTGILKKIDESHGLPTNYIYRLCKDTEGNYWMTSFGEGIIRFRDFAFKIYDDTQGLPSKSVNDIAEWGGELMLATDNGVVAMNNKKEIQQITKNVPIKSLTVTTDNKLLYNTSEAVLELSNTFDTPNIIDEGDYSIIYNEPNKTMLFGSREIKVLAKDSTYFIKSKRSIDIVPIDDRYILCKISGLFQMDEFGTDTIPGLSFLKHNDFRSIDVLDKNSVIAGSEKNLYHITLKKNIFKIKTFDMARFAGLKSFRALKVDGKNLWMAGKDMLIKVNLGLLLKKDTIVAKRYGTNAHFLENDIDINSLTIANDKTILATSLSGMLAFNEEEFLPNINPPKLDLSQIFLFSEPLNDSLYLTKDGLILPYQKNYLSFSMEAITFSNPENVNYRYRMKGLRDGDEWSPSTKEANVVFSYLPPGKYVFEFTADNGDGVWQKEPYLYPFTITVPFWRTSVFWIIIIFLTAATVFLFYYYKNKAEKKRNEIYTQNLIKAQEQERTRVARELHDSVGQKLMLLTKKTKSTGNLEMESLATNTLQELRAISRGLHPATLERLGPTAAIKNMIDEVDANTSIFFTHEIDDVDTFLSKEASLHLYRIIQEALNNMVKHAEARAASITIEKKKNTIEAVIKDNGKGFEHSEKLKTSDSLGMKTLVERAKILRSRIDIKSQLNKGTTITLIIPI